MIRKILVLSFVIAGFQASSFAAEEVGQFTAGARKQGLYTALELGGLFFSGFDREYSDGWVVGLKAGYDVFREIGVEGYFRFSGHQANTVTVSSGITPTFFLYQVGGLLKGAYPLTQRLFLGLGVGGGVLVSRPNHKIGRTSGVHSMFLGEGTIEYFTRTRGISLGLTSSASGVQSHKHAILQAGTYMRYSF